MDPKEFQRLTNPVNGMFRRWADPTNQSAIARFMREGIEPNKTYTKHEMKSLCKQYGIQKITDISNVYNAKKHSIGQIVKIDKEHNVYRLHPRLVADFYQYFWKDVVTHSQTFIA